MAIVLILGGKFTKTFFVCPCNLLIPLQSSNWRELLYHHRRPEFEYAAFNIRWHETKIRGQIVSMSGDRILQKDRREHSPGDHASEYPGFPKLERPNELYPDPLGKSR